MSLVDLPRPLPKPGNKMTFWSRSVLMNEFPNLYRRFCVCNMGKISPPHPVLMRNVASGGKKGGARVIVILDLFSLHN